MTPPSPCFCEQPKQLKGTGEVEKLVCRKGKRGRKSKTKAKLFPRCLQSRVSSTAFPARAFFSQHFYGRAKNQAGHRRSLEVSEEMKAGRDRRAVGSAGRSRTQQCWILLPLSCQDLALQGSSTSSGQQGLQNSVN